MVAFTTASSEAAYPKLMERLDRFGVNERVTALTLPLGYSFNLDGSMVYQAFAALFIAQAYGIEMSLGQQVTLLLFMMLSSKGVAGVPRASLVVVAAVLPAFGLPEAGLLLIMGIDQFLDMGRTATNVIGNASPPRSSPSGKASWGRRCRRTGCDPSGRRRRHDAADDASRRARRAGARRGRRVRRAPPRATGRTLSPAGSRSSTIRASFASAIARRRFHSRTSGTRPGPSAIRSTCASPSSRRSPTTWAARRSPSSTSPSRRRTGSPRCRFRRRRPGVRRHDHHRRAAARGGVLAGDLRQRHPLVVPARGIRDLRGARRRPVAVVRGTANEAAIREYDRRAALRLSIVVADSYRDALACSPAAGADALAADDVLVRAALDRVRPRRGLPARRRSAVLRALRHRVRARRPPLADVVDAHVPGARREPPDRVALQPLVRAGAAVGDAARPADEHRAAASLELIGLPPD